MFASQNPDVIDQGVFHNDVIAVGNGNVLFYHEQAFHDEAAVLNKLRESLEGVGANFNPIRVDSADVSVADAVASYLFNSQLLTKPDGNMALVIPQECQETAAVARYLEQLVASGCGAMTSMRRFTERPGAFAGTRKALIPRAPTDDASVRAKTQ